MTMGRQGVKFWRIWSPEIHQCCYCQELEGVRSGPMRLEVGFQRIQSPEMRQDVEPKSVWRGWCVTEWNERRPLEENWGKSLKGQNDQQHGVELYSTVRFHTTN